jgi:hypothetical protein
MNFIQGTLQMVEVGKGSVIVRLIPLLVAVVIVGFGCNFGLYHGLDDPQSMDNAQLARQIVRGQGFTTEFLRPHAIAQLRDYAVSQGLQSGKPRDLFPSDQFPPGAPRILPDTYNAPGYPYLLAGWFLLVHPEFEQTPNGIMGAAMYSPDRWIPLLNQIFLVLTAGIVFALGHRLFDERVAWMGLVAFLVTDLVWKYSLTGLSTSVLMFLATAALYAIQEILQIGEACFTSEERSFRPAWIWGVVLALVLAAICLTRLQLIVLLVPIVLLLVVMPRASVGLGALVTVLVVAAVAPWYFRLEDVSGSFLGSNAPLVLHGLANYEGNEIYCTTAIPGYEQLFGDAARKEFFGFRWNFEHAWSLLGANPLVLLFGASILHQFKRTRTRLFHWFIYACVVAILVANNLGSDNPEAIDPWNSLVILMPGMVVVGSAFFFILLDRLSLQLWLMNNLIVFFTLLLAALPLTINLTSGSRTYIPFAFPPYWPPMIKQLAQLTQPNEWVTSDMPWATAWYGDRASLWLPDSLADFENFHDNVCPTGLILFTPVTWQQPLGDVRNGEYKEWFTFAVGALPPDNFPLSVHTQTGNIPDYSLWSDRPRWQTK